VGRALRAQWKKKRSKGERGVEISQTLERSKGEEAWGWGEKVEGIIK